MERPRPSDWNLGADAIGEEIHRLAGELFPICRSITGDGVRQTLDILARHLPLDIHEVPTGTQVFDWTVPNEWEIRDAYVKDAHGRRVIDFAKSNLHVVGYSAPVHKTVTLTELKRHVFKLPEQPDLIPYRTSYYAETWGFCMAHAELEKLAEGDYEVCIDSSLRPGSLTYGEYLHRGDLSDEVLLSAHVCHPSLANDNCSGLALLTLLMRALSRQRTRYSYRVVFSPGTIGPISWLARNEANVGRIKHGLVVSCVGDGGGPTYKKSRRGDAVIDRAMAYVLASRAPGATILDFSPYGYDERQYCSPGFNLPVGLFQRSLHGTFPEYHTSGDNMAFIKPEHLATSYMLVREVLEIIEGDRTLLSTNPKCEPQLGRRGLYSAIGGDKNAQAKSMAMLWILNLADGRHSLLDMAQRSGLAFADIRATAELLETHGLLVETAST